MPEGIDYGLGFALVGGVLTSVVLLGGFISQFTKTDKDDQFFARAKEALTRIFGGSGS